MSELFKWVHSSFWDLSPEVLGHLRLINEDSNIWDLNLDFWVHVYNRIVEY